MTDRERIIEKLSQRNWQDRGGRYDSTQAQMDQDHALAVMEYESMSECCKKNFDICQEIERLILPYEVKK